VSAARPARHASGTNQTELFVCTFLSPPFYRAVRRPGPTALEPSAPLGNPAYQLRLPNGVRWSDSSSWSSAFSRHRTAPFYKNGRDARWPSGYSSRQRL